MSPRPLAGLPAAAIVLAALAAPAAAEPPFNIPINQSQSSVTATLTLAGFSDDDSSPVNGTIRVGIDNIVAPSLITLHGLQVNVVEPINLNINIFIAAFTATANNVTLTYTGPAQGTGPVAVTANQFAFTGVEATAGGTMSYNATGLFCTSLTSSGLPCSGNVNLADQGEQAGSFGATLSRVGRTVTMNGSIDVTSPLDPANPSTGSLRIQGTIRGSATVPCPSDFNGVGGSTVQDIYDYLTAWTQSSPAANTNGDTGVTVQDIYDFLSFWSAGC